MFYLFFSPLSQTWERGWGEGIKFWDLYIQPVAPLTPQFWGELDCENILPIFFAPLPKLGEVGVEGIKLRTASVSLAMI
jgi:hypothetical protein